MSIILEKIRLINDDLKNFEIQGSNDDPRLLEKLSRVNIVVGTNNSGKSRFLRGISKIENLSFIPRNFDKEYITILIQDIRKEVAAVFTSINSNVRDVNNFLQKIDSIRIPDTFTQKDILLPEISSLINTLATIQPNGIQLTNSSVQFHGGNWQATFSNPLNQIGLKYQQKFNEFIEKNNLQSISSKKIKKHYIPILRGLRPFSEDRQDIYKIRTKIDYFKEKDYPDHNISTGIDLYDEIRSCLLGDLEKRKIVSEFQDYLSKEFFENKPVAVIPKEKKQELALKIGKEKEQQIYDLGDGLQSLIIISFCIFKAKSEKDAFHLIFIEEPEIFIHPGLQRLLLKKMVQIPNCQFFFTTHSNHFLDITLDFENISVYRVNKDLDENKADEILPNFNIENVSSGDGKTLEILGVRDSSVFLSNCTVWVEGITDRMYLRHYLDLYQESKRKTDSKFVPFKEDTHFSFVEYGGANLVHFDFGESDSDKIKVKSITKNIFLIADRDSGKDNKHDKFTELLNDNYYPLPGREIENLVSLNILKQTVTEFESSKNNSDFSFKNRIQHRYYLKQYLGEYIEEKMIGTGTLKYSYRKEGGSGTIRDKIAFAKNVIKHTKTWDDLSSYTQDLVVKVFDFISSHNS
jgi:AAA15 family ATPase/GTPase